MWGHDCAVQATQSTSYRFFFAFGAALQSRDDALHQAPRVSFTHAKSLTLLYGLSTWGATPLQKICPNWIPRIIRTMKIIRVWRARMVPDASAPRCDSERWCREVQSFNLDHFRDFLCEDAWFGHLHMAYNWPYDHSTGAASLQAPSGGNLSSKIESRLPNRSIYIENSSK